MGNHGSNLFPRRMTPSSWRSPTSVRSPCWPVTRASQRASTTPPLRATPTKTTTVTAWRTKMSGRTGGRSLGRRPPSRSLTRLISLILAELVHVIRRFISGSLLLVIH
uniref:Uncharacterized protein n=1 Tax=Arundo donax TaxID=35708 RepID=A0A0A9E6R4_ARUDO